MSIMEWLTGFLHALLPYSLYSVDESRASQGAKAQTVNEEAGNAFGLALGKECEQDSATINTFSKLAIVAGRREMERGDKVVGTKGPSNQDTHTLH